MNVRNICDFDYVVAEKQSVYPAFANYNILYLNKLMENEWVNVVYQNSLMVILKNNKQGVDCIA